MRMVGNRPQESSGPKIAASQPIATQSADEELRNLHEQVRQKRGITSEEHFNAIAAYQPSKSKRNHSGSESEELRRLREENRFLRTSQRGPQPQQFQNHMNCDSQDAFQERVKNETRRMQPRLDGFIRNHANRNNRQKQPRAWTREGRPVCDICGRVGHVRQNCYARVDQRNRYENPQNTQPRTQTGPRIAALEA